MSQLTEQGTILGRDVHDLAEAETGDIPVFEVQQQGHQVHKYQLEQHAMVHITEILGGVLSQEIYDLWQEYEVQLQHNEASLSTWLSREKQMVFQSQWMKDYCAFDTTLALFAELIQKQAIEKLQENREDIPLLKAEANDNEA